MKLIIRSICIFVIIAGIYWFTEVRHLHIESGHTIFLILAWTCIVSSATTWLEKKVYK